MPGQFRSVATRLAELGHSVDFITKRRDREIPGVRRLSYAPLRRAYDKTHHYVRSLENSVLHGQQVQRICLALKSEGSTPDLVVAHPGWGESLFVKDVFGDVPLICYAEFYYRSCGSDVGFDPSEPVTLDQAGRLRITNSTLLLSLEAADRGWSPTRWQKSQFPDFLHSKIETIFDGIDTDQIRPEPKARLELGDGKSLSAVDEVITYVARNLEPYRGFPVFMRAIAGVLKQRPHAHVVIAGGDGVSYGSQRPDGRPWREVMQDELDLPLDRVHFLGHIPHARYLDVLRISSIHVYLTYPFVLSWSFMEAMAAGCLMIASDTAPVREVMTDGENGLLCDFFDHDALCDRIVEVLGRGAHTSLRRAARQTIIEGYDLGACLEQQLDMFDDVSGRSWRP